ncbi:MAG: glycosyltransferase [Desulfobacterales bacterium]
MKYSIIILLEDCHSDFAHYIRNLHGLFSGRKEPFEMIIMANGTGGFLRDQLPGLSDLHPDIKAFEMTPTTQSACLKGGLKESTGDIIVVCGSYQQITNASFAKLLEALDSKTDLISPWRRRRIDGVFSRFQSMLFNWIVRKTTRFDVHDLSCTVSVFRREVLEETELYGGMYRFLSILADRKGFKTREIECEHFQERGKSGLYPLSDYLGRLLDIVTLYFNTRFTKKPLRFFSTIGVGFISVGILIFGFVLFERAFLNQLVGDRPILLMALLSMAIGVQAAGVGLLGEIISFTLGRDRKEYTIEKIIA